MLKNLFARLARNHTAVPPSRLEEQLTRIERLVTRLQRDVDRIKLFSATVLEPNRAIALLANGYQLYVDPRDRGCGINLLTEGKVEENELTVLKRYLHPGAVVLDIGANYGLYSINLAPYVRPGGQVIGFEPNPHICDLFRSSIYVNGFGGLVEARQLGVHNVNGNLRFYINETEPGGARIVSQEASAPAGAVIIDVPVVRLDDHFPETFVADAVKIDVEGQEEQVLRGMQALIRRSPKIVILMEMFYPFFADDTEFANFIKFIHEDLGLQISQIGPGGVVTLATIDMLRGTTGSVLLSKQAPEVRPDLSIVAQNIELASGAERIDEQVVWTRKPGTGRAPKNITFGPYLYVPAGLYRLVVDADFSGDFILQLQENCGDVIGRYEVPDGNGFATVIQLSRDAPFCEILFRTTSGSRSLRFRAAHFWKL